MSGLDKELEAAYAATKKRQDKLEQSKEELQAVSAQGEQLASRSKTIALTVTLAGTAVGAGILLIDPDSRPWGFLLLFVVAIAGLWSFYRQWANR